MIAFSDYFPKICLEDQLVIICCSFKEQNVPYKLLGIIQFAVKEPFFTSQLLILEAALLPCDPQTLSVRMALAFSKMETPALFLTL